MNSNPIRFIHISDTHIGPTDDFTLQEVPTLPKMKALVEHIKSLAFTPDFIVHTGDMVHELPDAANEVAYKTVEDLMQLLSIPIYYVTGNHDSSRHVKQLLTMGTKEDLSDQLNSYRFDREGVRFLTLDAWEPEDRDGWHGTISPEQMDIIRTELESHDMPLVILVHYPAVQLDSVWVDRDMGIRNGAELHTLLARHQDRVRGVFFGHVHRPMSVVREGILYASAGSPCVQFTVLPEQQEVAFQRDGSMAYNIVTITPDQTVVKSHSICSSR